MSQIEKGVSKLGEGSGGNSTLSGGGEGMVGGAKGYVLTDDDIRFLQKLQVCV